MFKTRKKIKTSDPVLVVNMDSLKAASTYRHVIKVGDRVQVRFLNNYDLGQAAGQSATASESRSGSISEQGYLVNYDSTSTLPLIGRVNLVGKDRLQAAKYLEEQYSKFISNPIIDVNIASLTVTVLGEVAVSGMISIDKENTTLVEVIARAGGIKDTGKKNYIKIIRGNEVIIVNLKDIYALKDQNILIQHRDIIYVEPYAMKAFSEPLAGLQNLSSLVFLALQLSLLGIQIYSYTNR